MQPFDTAKPNVARVWDYWLGGKDNFAADRELAQKMLELYPLSAQMARENRQFLGRAVGYVADQGIRQFIDVGAGLPTAVNTHDVACRAAPGAKVAYVDNDPVVLAHAQALLATAPGVIALAGDMRDPDAILADPGLARLIRLDEPVCVLLSGVLHFVDASTAADRHRVHPRDPGRQLRRHLGGHRGREPRGPGLPCRVHGGHPVLPPP
jgi:S-adenosyl methyltransferase